MRTPRHIRSIRSAALTAATTLVCVGLVAFCAFGVPAYEPDAGGIEPQPAEEAAGDVSAGEENVDADEEAAVEEDAEVDEAQSSGKKAKQQSKKDGGSGDEAAETDGSGSAGDSGASDSGNSSGSAGAKASGGSGRQKSGKDSSGAAGGSKGGSGASKDAGSKTDTITVTVIVDSSRAAAWGWPDALANMQVSVPVGSSVYDALCATGLKVGGSSSYVSSIAGLAERACGSMSGWLYYVDGEWASKPAGSYVLSGGETIQWIYTCSNGSDVDL